MKTQAPPLIPIAIAAALALGVGVIAGYYVGFDQGFESAIGKMKSDQKPAGRTINDFEQCEAAGYPIMESYPRQCRTPDGRTFVEIIEAPPSTEPDRMAGCAPAGCSGQLCVDARDAADIVTTCEFRAEYACYRAAACERQSNGECGWTETPELSACLANPPSIE